MRGTKGGNQSAKARYRQPVSFTAQKERPSDNTSQERNTYTKETDRLLKSAKEVSMTCHLKTL